jgi:hypothetical protein
MHDYSISSHSRKNVHYIIAATSFCLVLLAAYFIAALQNTYEVAIVAPSSLAVFGFLFGIFFLIFDQFLWRCSFLYRLVKIPNLNGSWNTEIKSSQDTEARIKATINIHQTYSKIRIRLETDKSHSLSQMAAFEMADPTYFCLRYEYSTEYQRDKNAQILRHYGVTCLRLKSPDHNFSAQQSATYYTEQGRDSHGTMVVIRKQGQIL